MVDSTDRIPHQGSPAPAPSPSPRDADSETNIKELVESILVAFILAFIFRTFVVEAFVIPTGSMAPTLLGAHMRFRCDDCGYQWDVNYPSGNSAGPNDEMVIPSRTNELFPIDPNTGRQLDKILPAWCPNCGYPVTASPAEATAPDNIVRDTPVRYGDRILVLKYLYLFSKPRRWDVVVFKTPDQPEKWDYTQNYIKRLVGRPGETVMILDGDIYIASSSKPADQLRPEDFTVQTKPRGVQDELWRIIYDNDFHPQNTAPARVHGDEPLWRQPWQLARGAGWDTSADTPASDGGRIFRFENPTGGGTLLFDPAPTMPNQPLTDWLGYDVTRFAGPGPGAPDNVPGGYRAESNVSDLRLAFTYQRDAGAGPLRAELTKLGVTFIAELTPGHASLYQRGGRGARETLLKSVPLPEGAGSSRSGAMRVEFMNVDYRVTLRVDGRDLITTTPADYRPDIPALMQSFRRREKSPPGEARLIAAKQSCRISHLSLWRDVYYLNGAPIDWATPEEFPAKLMRLGPGEYFVCGDNSPISGDGRYWKEPIRLPYENLFVEAGRVPERFMLGKAFFVYWPAGYRPIPSAPALAPNFGDMRFVR